jgi:tRNA(adenine34) deaminase
MQVALDEAQLAIAVGEIPIASVLVAEEEEVGHSQTHVKRLGPIAHGESTLLFDLGFKVYSLPRPITIYTNVEPCLMCLGACINAGIDNIVYGMPATPDGGAWLADTIRKSGIRVPEIIVGVGEIETVALMREFLQQYPSAPAVPYVTDLLRPYDHPDGALSE